MNLHKVSTIQNQISDILRTEIISGQLGVGDKLNEIELAKRFGVSRGPIRDVLLLLGKEGLTYTKGSSGTFISDPLDNKTEKILCGIRLKLEEFSLKQLINTATFKDLLDLESIISRMDMYMSCGNKVDCVNTTIDFHKHCVELGGCSDIFNVWYPIIMRIHANMGLQCLDSFCLQNYLDLLDGLKRKDSHSAVIALKKILKP
ncbi:GntR family transcriptional regulator [Saccharobesus litoralis]|uniref:GntR family transcriptional regulator n=1 Tax=Saccharobesus litoralis TaxID=2172099 RepID=A0A2S0VLP4_9ALTE|nr:GntR family transcriptional regulator [Saccharobesus litoralis]AWB65129.1 GntR family transcriptional regulator [Saccharobesus litoralis]